MAVNLEKGPRTDAVDRLGLIGEMLESNGCHELRFLRSVAAEWLRFEHVDACHPRESAGENVSTILNTRVMISPGAGRLDQDLTVVCISEELDLVNSVQHLAC